MNKQIDVLVKCPFYLQEKENVITCEGYIGNTCMLTRFRSPAAKRAHMRDHCFLEDGGECFMAKSLYAKYEREG